MTIVLASGFLPEGGFALRSHHSFNRFVSHCSSTFPTPWLGGHFATSTTLQESSHWPLRTSGPLSRTQSSWLTIHQLSGLFTRYIMFSALPEHQIRCSITSIASFFSDPDPDPANHTDAISDGQQRQQQAIPSGTHSSTFFSNSDAQIAALTTIQLLHRLRPPQIQRPPPPAGDPTAASTRPSSPPCWPTSSRFDQHLHQIRQPHLTSHSTDDCDEFGASDGSGDRYATADPCDSRPDR
ncbi:hypothetical protein ACLOJK_000216 [Asimina triloba]